MLEFSKPRITQICTDRVILIRVNPSHPWSGQNFNYLWLGLRVRVRVGARRFWVDELAFSGSVAEFVGKKREDHWTFTAERRELGLDSRRSAAFNSRA
jgi:hypothetical protein